jgi:hypothetical protein
MLYEIILQLRMSIGYPFAWRKNQQNMLAPTSQQRQKDPSSYGDLRLLSMIMLCMIHDNTTIHHLPHRTMNEAIKELNNKQGRQKSENEVYIGKRPTTLCARKAFEVA